MAKLIYLAMTSLDGYLEDARGAFDWAEPSDEVHAFVNDLARPVGTYLYGRRMYETMVVWETEPSLAAQSPVMADFARLWQGADKIVFSRTLASATTERTRIERDFDADLVGRLKATAACHLAVGGPDLAAHAFRAGLVDQCHLFVAPIVVGGGRSSLPAGIRLELDLLDERRFADGMVHLHYRVRP